MNKKGRSEIEKAISTIFGIIIIFILISSGFISQVFQAFSGLEASGGILSILFILMIVAVIWEAFRRK